MVQLINVATFDYLYILHIFEIDIFSVFNVTDTNGFNENFDALGYDSRSAFDNLGTLNFIYLFVLAKIGLFFVTRA